MNIKLKYEETRRQRGLDGKSHVIDGNRRTRVRDKVSRAMPTPQANAELQTNLDRLRIMSDIKAKRKREKFPPPHKDGAVGHPLSSSQIGPESFEGDLFFLTKANVLVDETRKKIWLVDSKVTT